MLAFVLTPLAPARAQTSPPSDTFTHSFVTAAQHSDQPFMRNLGQTDPRVQFYSQGDGSKTFFTSEGIVFALLTADSVDRIRANLAQGEASTSASSISSPQPRLWQMAGIRFEQANPAPRISGVSQLPGVTNYLLGSETSGWIFDVPSYSAVLYSNLYDGIHVLYEQSQGKLKTSYMVQPGADPRRIRLRYLGGMAPELDAQGQLHMQIPEAAIGTLIDQAPVSWQESNGQRLPVQSAYHLDDDGSISFELGSYNQALPLVIDPSIMYRIALPLGFAQYADVTTGGSGEAYVTGATDSPLFPRSANPYQGQMQGADDVFISRYNNDVQVYSTIVGGNADDQGMSIKVSGTVAFVTGVTYSFNFPSPGTIPGYRHSYTGSGGDIFVIKLDTAIAGSAALLYSTFYGGGGTDVGKSIAINGTTAMVLAKTTSAGLPGMNGFDGSYNGNGTDPDCIVLRFLTTGSTLGYASYLGSSREDSPGAIANIPSSNIVYVVGKVDTSTPITMPFPMKNAYKSASENNSDMFYAKINMGSSGPSSLLVSSYFGGTGGDGVSDTGAVAVGTDGKVYIAGTTYSSSDFPYTTKAYDKSYAGSGDAFLAQMIIPDTGPGAVQYASYLGGSQNEQVYDMVLESNGRVTLVGVTFSSDFPSINSASMPEQYQEINGTNTGYVAQFNPINLLNSLSDPTQGLSFMFYLDRPPQGVAVSSKNLIYTVDSFASVRMITPAPPKMTAYYVATSNATQFYNLGCALGTNDKNTYGRQDNFVILFFGQPWSEVVSGTLQYGGVLYDQGNNFIPRVQIDNAVRKYGQGYTTCVTGGNDTLSSTIVAIGTSNSGSKVTTTHATEWAGLVNSVDSYFVANGYSNRIRAVAAIDFEPMWSTPAIAKSWINAYDSVNTRPIYFFGSADGCSDTDTGTENSNCNNGWSRDDVWFVSKGSTALAQDSSIPQIYTIDTEPISQARQWARIAIYSQAVKLSSMKFGGALTQEEACKQKQNTNPCNNGAKNTPVQGWRQLRDETSKDGRSLQQYLRWSADIQYWP